MVITEVLEFFSDNPFPFVVSCRFGKDFSSHLISLWIDVQTIHLQGILAHYRLDIDSQVQCLGCICRGSDWESGSTSR